MKRVLPVFILISVFAFSCRKEPKVVSGGVVRALITVQHHGVPIANAAVFYKKGTIDFPGTDTTQYDGRFQCDANGRYTFDNLPNGQSQYIFYAKGVDPGWDSTHVTPVWGYEYLLIDTHTGENKDYPLSIPVSE